MGRGKAKVELEELMGRLRAIEQEMPDKKRKSGPGLAESVKMDKFMVLKNSITGRLISVKALIGDIQEAGNTNARERIAKQQQVRQQIKEITEEYKEMRGIYDKEIKKRKSKFTKQELERRGDYVRQYSREIEKIKELASRGYLGDKYRKMDDAGPRFTKVDDLLARGSGGGARKLFP